jgi:sortase A
VRVKLPSMRRQPVVALALSVALLAACGHSKKAAPVVPATTFAAVATTVTTTAPTTTTLASTTTTLAPTTTTTAAPTTTTTAAPTTTTEKAPERVVNDNVGIGKIEIPKLGVTEYMFEGIELSILDKGPGHWPDTAMPGQIGNMVIAGHRVSHTHPFLHINDLGVGDEVYFSADGKKYRYEVTGTEIVDPSAIRIVDPTPTATATLFACHPPGSVAYRWVTYLKYAP